MIIRTFALAILLALGAMTALAVADDHHEAAEGAALSVDSTIGELLENPGARAVLERHIPSVVADPLVGMSAGQSLRALAQRVPGLTEAKLAEINRDLAALDGAPFFQ